MEKLTRPSRIDEERIQKLKELFPEAFADGKVNFSVLKEEIAGLDEELFEENEEEAYGLRWVGKKEARRLAFLPPSGTLKLAEGEGVNEDTTKNILIEGDNLEVLRLLQKSYAGKIKMIYIDPPYNTGNDFIYKDDFRDPVDRYLHKSGQADEEGLLVSNPKASGRYHTNWLNMMYPRLKLARNLLRDDGVIFVSIDDNEQANLKLLMDEVFGEENFIANVIWQHSIQPKGYLGKFSIHHNHILIYAKTPSFSLGSLNRTEEHNKAYSNPDNDPNGPWRPGDVRNSLYRPNLIYDIVSPSGKVISPPPNGWRWSKETMEEKIRTGEIIFNKDETGIIRKIYLKNVEGRAPETIWFGKEVGTTRDGNKILKQLFENEVPFDTPKPVGLIKRMLQLSTSNIENEIVLDFFAGSGTTAQAVLEMNLEDGGNRKFILVQIPEPINHQSFSDIAEVTKERIRRSIKQLKTQENTDRLDLGFSIYKLDKSNMRKWAGYSGERVDQLEQQLNFEPFTDGWKEKDVVIELMLHEGFPLDSRITKEDLSNNRLWVVNHEDVPFRLVVCLDSEIKDETIEHITQQFLDDMFICLDNAFSDQGKVILSETMRVKTI